MISNKATLLLLDSKTIYTPDQIKDALEISEIKETLIKTKGIEIYNAPCAFDIETYSFYNDKQEKQAIMYIWQLCLNGVCIVGRTWDEYVKVCEYLSSELELNEKKRLIIFVHNLSYEFQFLKDWFGWFKVFAVDKRKPVYAITDQGIEYRCSYILSGYSLAMVAKNLKYKIKKLDSLDYNLARHSQTPITKGEMQYCLNDVKIVVLYIYQLLETELNINTFPLTKTGFVRRFCRNQCFYESENKKNSWKKLRYNELMSGLTLNEKEYNQLKRAFQGGFTHASAWYSGKTVKNVMSMDETSAYPYVMVACEFPMSAPEYIEIHSMQELEKNFKLYCCCFDIEFIDLEPITIFENYISVSRCWEKHQVVENNGRVVSAALIKTTITEQDFFIIKRMYTWKSCRISNFMRFRKDYLPRDYVKAVLTLYADKTTLKGVKGQEQEYQSKKEMLNSCYGMSVTDIVQELITYVTEWTEELPNISEVLEKYNKDKNRFLFYAWGVWVCAYGRSRVLNAILEVGENDYLYCDTDAVKFMHWEEHLQYFIEQNKIADMMLDKACKHHHFNKKMVAPVTVKGEVKTLGYWDFDGLYKYFKALRAKCYCVVEYEDVDKKTYKPKSERTEFFITVAGLNKRVTVPWLEKTFGDTPILGFYDDRLILENIKDGLNVPPEATGKNTHTYIDTPCCGVLTDYLGNTAAYSEKSFIHLEMGSYVLGLTEEYVNYILTFREDQAQ